MSQIIDRYSKQDEIALHNLHAHINHNLEHIEHNLQSDLKREIKNIESSIENKIITQQKEYQDYTTKWLQHNAKEFLDEVATKSDGLTTQTIAKLSETITNNINKELENRLKNLKDEIDLSTLIESIRNDAKIIENIKKDSINSITKDLLENKQAMTNEIQAKAQSELLDYLKNKIDLDSIIKAALDSDVFTDEIKAKIDSKVIETINASLDSDALKQEINTQIQNLKEYSETKKQEFNKEIESFLETLKSGSNETLKDSINALNSHINNLKTQSNESLESFKNDLNTLLETLKDSNKETLENITQDLYNKKDSIISEFNAKLKESLPYIINEAVNNIVSETMQNEKYMQHIKDNVIEKGYTYIKEFENELKNAIIEKITNYAIENVDIKEIKEIILQDSKVLNLIKDSAYNSTKDILNHALLKEFVTNALKEKAKEILTNDELLRANAEAQAHIVFMRLQSEMVTIGDVIDKLQISYDIQNKLDILLEKEKVFNEALANAKKDLQDELNAELPKFDEKIKNALQDYDTAQDKQTDEKIANLQQEMLDLTQKLQEKIDDLNTGNTNTNTNLNDLITKLQEKIKEQEQINAAQEAKIKANTDLNNLQEKALQDSIAKDKDIESKLEKLDKDLQDSIKNNQNNQNNQNAQKPTTGSGYLIWN